MDLDKLSNIVLIIFCFLVGLSETVQLPYLQSYLGEFAYALGGFKLANQMRDRDLRTEVRHLADIYNEFDIQKKE